MNTLDFNPQSTLETILLENLKEARRKRRWGIFFKLAFLLIVIILLLLWFVPGWVAVGKLSKPHTSIVDITGIIMPGSINNSDNIVTGLTKAFKDPHSKGIILRINSPGGSPVQASYIYNNIIYLRKQYPNKKIYAVCSDMCTSAAYYVASAANEIYADPSTLVGSIGVLLNGFGFVDTMQKLGISRRLITAGSEKGFLDPFSPLKPEDEAYAKTLLNQVHEQFINAVKKGRGNRLNTQTPLLFSGLAWTGLQAKNIGLIDGFGSAGYVAHTIIQAPTVVDYTHKRSIFDRLGTGLGASFAQGIVSAFSGELH